MKLFRILYLLVIMSLTFYAPAELTRVVLVSSGYHPTLLLSYRLEIFVMWFMWLLIPLVWVNFLALNDKYFRKDKHDAGK